MRVVCAWCRKVLDAGGGPDDREVSHGICPGCNRFFFDDEESGAPLDLFLEGLPVPVIVLGAGGEVRSANAEARVLAGLSPEELADTRSGDVIACMNAAHPGGCGTSEDCSGCVVRRIAESTFFSGESEEAITGPKDVLTPIGPRQVRFRIASRKRGDVVLLRIDEVEDAV